MSSLKKLNYLLLILIGLVVLFWLQRPKPTLKLVFCAVGQGDAELIIWKNQQVLVDGGPNNRILDCLGRYLPFWDRKIEVVIASHAEADHITGLVGVAGRYEIGEFLAIKEVNDTAEYEALVKALQLRQVPIKELTQGGKAALGSIKLEWLWPEKSGSDSLAWQNLTDYQVLGVKTSLNEFSQVIKLTYGAFDVLLAGDIDATVEKKIVTDQVEVLKVAHHGSKYSSSEAFLRAVSPKMAVIEVGKNSYGHPTQETLDRLNSVGAKISRTDQGKDIVVVSDGANWWLEE